MDFGPALFAFGGSEDMKAGVLFSEGTGIGNGRSGIW